MIQEEHLHTPDDGRGLRKVFINGKERQRICFADTRKGYAIQYRKNSHGDFMLDGHKKRILTRRLKGKIVIVPGEGGA